MRLASAEHTTRKPTSAEAVALLQNGKRMDQKAFHEIYLLTPPKFKAELIGGTVYVSSPVYARHGIPHARVIHWLSLYMDKTPGLDVLDNTTSILSEESEPQPDACMVLSPEYGGKTIIEKYISGPLDLVVEVANSSQEIDLGVKKQAYERAGVREYVVVLAKEQTVRWFRQGKSGFKELLAGGDGLFRSTVFPGLWLDPRGFFSENTQPLTLAVKKGLASPEHATFVAELKARRKKKPATKAKRKAK